MNALDFETKSIWCLFFVVFYCIRMKTLLCCMIWIYNFISIFLCVFHFHFICYSIIYMHCISFVKLLLPHRLYYNNVFHWISSCSLTQISWWLKCLQNYDNVWAWRTNNKKKFCIYIAHRFAHNYDFLAARIYFTGIYYGFLHDYISHKNWKAK